MEYISGFSALLFLILTENTKIYTTTGYPKTFEYLNLVFPNRIIYIENFNTLKFDVIHTKSTPADICYKLLNRPGFLIVPVDNFNFYDHGLIHQEKFVFLQQNLRIAFYTDDPNCPLKGEYSFLLVDDGKDVESNNNFIIKRDDKFENFDLAIFYRKSSNISIETNSAEAITIRALRKRTNIWDILGEDRSEEKYEYIIKNINDGMQEEIDYYFDTNLFVRNLSHKKEREIHEKLKEINDIRMTMFFTFQSYIDLFHILPSISKVSELVRKMYYVNLDRRSDRRREMEGELKKMNLDVERFSAIEEKIGSIGCAKSHLALLRKARDKGYENVLIIEDDFEFLINANELEIELNNFFNTCSDFDVVMLGYNLLRYIPNINRTVGRIIEGQTTSGYLVNKKFYNKLISVWEEGLRKLIETKDEKLYSADQSWKKLQPNSNWYFFMKRIGKQRAGYSDIENRYTDYNA